jgi:uncharacterized membrane protein YeaQ/YmgE (transglycosylase-associated protein family)
MFGLLVAGLIIGALARLIKPGKQNLSILATLGLGLVGSVIGGLIAQFLGTGSIWELNSRQVTYTRLTDAPRTAAKRLSGQTGSRWRPANGRHSGQAIGGISLRLAWSGMRIRLRRTRCGM